MAKKNQDAIEQDAIEQDATGQRKHELKGLLVWGSIVYTTIENHSFGVYISDEDLELLVESKPELKQLCKKWNGQEL